VRPDWANFRPLGNFLKAKAIYLDEKRDVILEKSANFWATFSVRKSFFYNTKCFKVGLDRDMLRFQICFDIDVLGF
jgi:hypothetical protein